MIKPEETYILIPSYEPDDMLIKLTNSLLDIGFSIIVVNDGSKKEFDHIFDALDKRIILLKHETNKGKGRALRLGFSYANLHKEDHKYVITCDSDGQHSINDVIRINDRLHETNHVIFGVRKFGKNVPKKSRDGNRMSRICRTYLTKDYIQDDQCGLRGYPIQTLPSLITIGGDHYEYEMNVVCAIQMMRYQIDEIPIETIYINNNAATHFRPSLDTYRIQRIIWSYSFVPLVIYFVSLGLFSLSCYFLKDLNPMILYVMNMFYTYWLYIGLISFVWPSKKMGRRTLIEGEFHTTKYVVGFGLFVLFTFVCKFYPIVSFSLSMFIVSFLNFFLALLNWKIKTRRRKV